MSILPQTSNNTSRRDAPEGHPRKRTEAATYARIVEAAEARNKRLEAARQATAAFTGNDDGDILFA